MFKYDFSQWQKTLYHTNVDEIKSKTDSLVIISLQLYSSISPLPMSSHFPLSSYTCLNSHFKFSKTSTRLSRTPWKHNKNVLISFYINRTVGNIVLFPFFFFAEPKRLVFQITTNMNRVGNYLQVNKLLSDRSVA